MSVLNRRNAVAGWAVWKLGKHFVRTKVGTMLRRKPPPPPPPLSILDKARSRPKALGAALVAAGAGLAAFLRLRKGGRE